MDDAFAVRVFECPSGGEDVLGGSRCRQRVFARQRAQVRPFDVFHYQVRIVIPDADMIDRNDVRMLQSSGDLCFGKQPLRQPL
jgi:hypothetical protein